MWNYKQFWHALIRKKPKDNEPSKLARVLTLFDLTALGVGSTLGLGAYVLAGSVAYEQAGPAVTLSFVVAAIASVFAGICYAEFAARVPKAGSAYVYSYVTIGEFVAFTIGWNLILEYVIGTASVASGLSNYIDALAGNQMEKDLTNLMPINVNFLGKYPDILSFFLVLTMAGLLSFGVRASSNMNIIFTALNLVTICVMIIAGAIKSDPANWQIPKEDIPDGVNGGNGGFMPFGIAGVMAGAARCFYGFVGFDCIATTGEEAINPQRNIPWSIVMSLLIIFLSYFGVSTVLTMMWPYYLQDPSAPFIHVFQQIGWIEIKWIVTVGAIFALCTNLLGAMFPLPRVLYAMASDGILYRKLQAIDDRTKTPLIATIVSGILSAIMALLFDVHQLIDMMSIGTLIAYTIVSLCILILRYEYNNNNNNNDDDNNPQQDSTILNNEKLTTIKTANTRNQILSQLLNVKQINQPNQLTSNIVKLTVIIFCIFAIIFCILLNQFAQLSEHEGAQILTITLVIIFVCLFVTTLIVARQPMLTEENLMFKVPLVPWLPCFSVLINLYLIFQLDIQTWIRFCIWAAVGYFIYFTYGIRRSVVGNLAMQQRQNSNNINNSFEEINRINFN